MKQFYKYIVLILVAAFSVVVFAQTYSKQMTPIESEKLKSPISLTKICSEVKIVEWRDSGTEETKATKDNIKTLDKYCKIAMDEFPKFINERGYHLDNHNKFKMSVCFMPVNISPRNLNDIVYRFSNRTKTYDEDGNVYPIWGYFQRYTNHIYVRNTGATEHKVVFVHELFHAASYYYGIYEQHSGDKDSKDEIMAREFTIHLGLGE